METPRGIPQKKQKKHEEECQYFCHNFDEL